MLFCIYAKSVLQVLTLSARIEGFSILFQEVFSGTDNAEDNCGVLLREMFPLMEDIHMQLAEKHCVPCEGGTSPLTREKEDELIAFLDTWQIIRDAEPHSIRKRYTFDSFRKAIGFVNRIAEVAEQEQHHPDILIQYSRVTVTLCTHAIKGLSENDFILAARIEGLEEPEK